MIRPPFRLWVVLAACVRLCPTATAAAPDTEEEWITRETVTHLERLTSLGTKRTDPPSAWQMGPAGDAGSQVTGAGLPAAVTVTPGDHSWDPTRYGALAMAWVERHGLGKAATRSQPVDATATPDVAASLLSPTAARLQEVNQKLSESLRRDPANPTLHRQAAFLLGVFALRENSGHFHDTRSILCRLTAHRALATVLDRTAAHGQPTPEASLLPILVDVLVGREQSAVAALGPPDPADTPEAAWRRALDLHVRMDWRPHLRPGAAPPRTLIEKRALFRAVTNTVDPDSAIQLLEKWPEEEHADPDWARMVLKFDTSVSSGHFCNNAFELEVRDAGRTLDMETREMDPAAMRELAALMNADQSPDPATPFVIIPRSEWGRHSQRHLLQFALRQIPWFEKMLGSPESGQEFMQSLAPLYFNLHLFPLAGFECWSAMTKSERQASLQKAIALIDKEPWSVVARRWMALENGKLSGIAVPEASRWFTSLTPRGTQYNAYNRRLLSGADSLSGAALARARTMAPFDPMLAYWRASELLNEGASPEELEREAGDLIHYHAALAHVRAQRVKDDVDAYIKAMRTVVAINPDMNREFARFLLEKGRLDDAMASYQALFDNAIDPLRAANHSDLLMHYHLAKGNRAKAREIASFGAGVFSSFGLQTMIDYCIATGDAEGARDWAQQLMERYDDRYPLMSVAFHFPQLAKDTGFDSFVGALFPDGIKKVALADFTDPPKHGVRFMAENGFTKAVGLFPHDVVVAVQGYRIANREQYTFARNLHPGLEVRLILWDGDAYREIKTIVPHRRFEIELADFPP